MLESVQLVIIRRSIAFLICAMAMDLVVRNGTRKKIFLQDEFIFHCHLLFNVAICASTPHPFELTSVLLELSYITLAEPHLSVAIWEITASRNVSTAEHLLPVFMVRISDEEAD